MENGDHICKINIRGFAKAVACIIGLVYVVCAIFVTLWPDLALRLFGWLVHLVNIDKFAGDVNITAGGFIAGLVQIVIYSYVIAWLIAWLHNKFCKSN